MLVRLMSATCKSRESKGTERDTTVSLGRVGVGVGKGHHLEASASRFGSASRITVRMTMVGERLASCMHYNDSAGGCTRVLRELRYLDW